MPDPTAVVVAHSQVVTIQFIERWPDHPPRKDDPDYALFNAARRRLVKAGLLVCAIGDGNCYGGMELHHSDLEYAHAPDVDLDRLNKAYGLHLTEDEFAAWIESPGNLEPLCVGHHRGVYGVHSLPEPEWNAYRVAKATGRIVIAQKNSLIPVMPEPAAPEPTTVTVTVTTTPGQAATATATTGDTTDA